jgi:hypothetical protein
MAVPRGTAKFREETSKKADSAANRIAATHNLVPLHLRCNRFFASQHCLWRQHADVFSSGFVKAPCHTGRH